MILPFPSRLPNSWWKRTLPTRGGSFHYMYIYERPLTDICTISQSDANTCVCIHATDGQFSIATLKRMTLNYLYILYIYYIRRYTHIILYRFSSPYTACIAVSRSYIWGIAFWIHDVSYIHDTCTITCWQLLSCVYMCVFAYSIMWKRSSFCSTAVNLKDPMRAAQSLKYEVRKM